MFSFFSVGILLLPLFLQPPPNPPPPPPPPKKKKKKKNSSDLDSLSKFTYKRAQNQSCRVCTLKVIHILGNVDYTTCFTLCRWLLFFILPLLTVWHTVLVTVFPPLPPPPSPPLSTFFFLFRYGFLVKIHLLESSKLEL